MKNAVKGQVFVTSDGYILSFNGTHWTDGDLLFETNDFNLPVELNGKLLSGNLCGDGTNGKMLVKLIKKLRSLGDDMLLLKYQSIINGDWLTLSESGNAMLKRVYDGQVEHVVSIGTTEMSQTFLLQKDNAVIGLII